jgi:hypothetical protein
MRPTQVHEDEFLRILWDETRRIISIDWKESTSVMTDDEFKTELTVFAQHVEEKKAPRILIDVSAFRHSMGDDVQQWRLKNISTRYNAAGVRRFAFLFAPHSQVTPGNQSSEGERFLTQEFDNHEQAVAWLTGRE